MGYEIAGAWGARMARKLGEVFAFVGDGSYLMLNSELLSSVITGRKLVVVLCDNGGYAVIERLQVGQGGASFNNMFETIGPNHVEVDWVAHARSLGCEAERVDSIDDLPAALVRARAAERTYVIAMPTAPDAWTEGGAFWQVGVPEVSERPAVDDARARQTEGRSAQRVGW
jgi:3D-(3,5/4)-trihydroxycyclohexane-1,2-dione acylhydrolase (decyclizing)